jgi:uncharacterized membrane protein
MTKFLNNLNWVSLTVLLVSTILLWIFTKKTDLLLIITALVGLILLINITNYFIDKRKDKEVKESLKVIKYKINKYLAHSVFFFGIGIPLFIDSWIKGFDNNLLKVSLSVILVIIGMIYYSEYERRESYILNEESMRLI